MLRIAAGGFEFTARLEEAGAPDTVAAFRRLLPLESKIIHVRWSGEAGWIPFGELDLGLGPENATCYPHPGEIVLYPGGVSETEILLAYGYVSFASKAGQLAGNHFATIVEGNEPPPARGQVPLGGRAGDHLPRAVASALALHPADPSRCDCWSVLPGMRSVHVAHVSPCLRMTSPSASRSGGPPAAAARTAATSRK